MRTFWLRLFCLIAVVAVAVPSGSGSGGWLCAMSGRIGAACCCGLGPVAEIGPVAPQAERMKCCQRVPGDERAAAAAVRSPEPSGALALFVTPPASSALRARISALSGSWGSAQAAPRGPPLFIAHCALLL